MRQELRILGWRYENIRGGLRDVEIDLGDPPVRWTLVQMPNGTGKTTTMSLFRAVLAGEPLSPRTVGDLRSSDDAVRGQFELRISVDGKTYRLQLRLDYRAGTAQHWTARSEVRGGGLEEGSLLPNDLRRLLTREFTRLFVFDGELAKEIRTVGKERAAEAIRTLYRLERLDEVSLQVARLVEQRQQKAASVSTATERKGVTRWTNAVQAALAKRAELQAAVRSGQGRRKALATLAKDLRTQIDGHVEQDGTLKRRREELAVARGNIDKAVLEATAEGLSVLRSPGKLHPRIFERLHALGGKLNQLKLPKTISAEFFRELAEQPVCVCGRPLGHAERQAVLDGAGGYLAEDQIAVINAMKQALRTAVNDGSDYTSLTATLREKLKELQRNKTAHDQLELERIEAGDVELEALRLRERQALDELTRVEEALERLTTKDGTRHRQLGLDNDNNLPLCEIELKRCREKLATATDTRRFMLQADYVRSVVDQVGGRALDLLRERVRVATNVKLSHLVPSEALHVGRIAGALELGSPGSAHKSDVSEGQSLAVAYAFLTSLLTDAPYQLPFIVDSPAVSLDTRVRREVGELIPDLFGQMIMFVISSEKEGFADAFYGREDVRYLTLWRESETITAAQEGLECFRSFHVRAEAS